MTDVLALLRAAFAAYQRGNFARAEGLCLSILATRDDEFEARHLLAVLLTRRGSAEEALGHYDRALLLEPDDVQLLSNRGVALGELNRHQEALESLTVALSIQRDYAPALSNLGNSLLALGRYAESRAAYDAALAIGPDFAECRFNRARLLLLLGEFAEGWREYEWRRKVHSAAPPGLAAEWHGEDPRGKRLLLYSEQGLGDAIQFVRFARAAAERGAEVVLHAQPTLAALLRSLDGIAGVIAEGSPAPSVHLQLPLMSVPFVLGLGKIEIPAAVPYLKADPARVAAWASRLPEAGFRIGIAWQGNPRRRIDEGRLIPLRAFAPLARIPGVRLISLQKHRGVEQLAELSAEMSVETLGDGFDAGPDGFLDTAAVMMHLDLIVTSDSAIAHLAGALARPVWIVLQQVPDWRWMLETSETPWYPTARLFRQNRNSDWDEVFARLSGELVAMVAAFGGVG